MSKLDSMIKCAQARNLLDERQFQKAVEIIEQIDMEKVKSIMDLKTIGQVYMESRRFQEAREVYLHIYGKVQSRSVLYHLIYLSIQCGLLAEAEEFYQMYMKLDRDSVDCRILNYYLQKAAGANHTQLISCIREILSFEYLEEWAYELAKLYHKEGICQACIDECSRIILWFGEGIIVEKAMLLKLHYVEGLDISSSKAIDETRNIAAELRLAARIAESRERERENYKKSLEEEWQADEEGKGTEQNLQEALETEEITQNLQNNQENEEILQNLQNERELEETSRDLQDEQKLEEAPWDLQNGQEFEGQPQDLQNEPEFEGTSQDLQKEQEFEETPQGLQEDRRAENFGDVPPIAEWTLRQQAIDDIVGEALASHEMPHFFIVTDSDGQGAMEISKQLIRSLHEEGILETPRIAKISAAKINGINLEDKKEQLSGACLLIEGANELSLASMQTLCQIMKRRSANLVVGLVDGEKEIKELASRNRKLKKLVKHEIYI